MDDKQRAAFEAWTGYSEEALSRDAGDGYCIKGVDNEWRAWQAALASPEVQALRKDADRLDFMISEECQIQSLSLSNGVRHRLYWPDADEAQCEWSVNPRAAIDEAMEKKP